MAAKVAIQAEAEFCERLDKCLQEERSQAAVDRHELLSRITELIKASGEKQDARLDLQISDLRNDIAASSLTLRQADDQYNERMDLWSQKGNLLVDEVLKSRETLKSKMKNDWTVRFLYSRCWNVLSLIMGFDRASMSIIPQFKQPRNLSTKKQSALSTLR